MNTKSKELKYAGFWKRLGACLIDGFFLGIIHKIIDIVLLALFIGGDADSANIHSPQTMLTLFVCSIIISWLYYAIFESSTKQATIGKMLINIKVTDMEGARINFFQASARFFAKFLSAILLMIGFIMVAFTKKKQGLHDIVAKCLVVCNL